jgi:pyridoxal 5'-phosphate synthase pdxS subunit
MMENDGKENGTWRLKVGLAEMLKGGVILDVTNAEQARIAEDAGAAAVMALERVPADIRREGGVARMAAVEVIEQVRAAVSIPVMAKCRIGHTLEARVLEALGVDFVDESEVLTPADEEHHVDKHAFRVPFVCGARDLGEALRRIGEGAAMIRTKGEAGSGNIVEAVRHLRRIGREIRALVQAPADERMARAKDLGAPYELVVRLAETGGLPVPNFAAGGIATPADAALCMSLGAEAVFVGSGIFKSAEPAARARAIVRATTHWQDAGEILAASRDLGAAMPGLEMEAIPETERLARRGW